MVQQRDRRYKKPTLDKILNSPIKYDTNRVTPGTYLMTQLNKEFTKIIEKKKFGEISVVYDGSNIPGEAEQKYLNLIESIKTNPKEN